MVDPVSKLEFYGFVRNFETYEKLMNAGMDNLARSKVWPKDMKAYELLHNYLKQHPDAKQRMEKLFDNQKHFFDHPSISADRGEGSKTNPADTFMKGKDNVSDGFFGGLFQMLG